MRISKSQLRLFGRHDPTTTCIKEAFLMIIGKKAMNINQLITKKSKLITMNISKPTFMKNSKLTTMKRGKPTNIPTALASALLLPLAVSFSLMLSGCALIPQTPVVDIAPQPINVESAYSQQEIEAERAAFDAFTDKCFIELVTSDTLTLHQILEYPEKYGIENAEVTFGSFSKGAFSSGGSPTNDNTSTASSESASNSLTDDSTESTGNYLTNGSTESTGDYLTDGSTGSTGGNLTAAIAAEGDGTADSELPPGENVADESVPGESLTDESVTYESVTGAYPDLDHIPDATDEEILDMLRGFNRAVLTDSQQLTYDVFEDAIELSIMRDEYRLFAEPLSTISGEHAMLPVILSEYRFQRLEDMYTYLALIETLPEYITSLLDFEKEKSAAGLFMSDAAADEVIKSCRSFTEYGENHILIASFDNRIAELDDLSDEERGLYSGINARLVREVFIPEFERLAQGIESLKGTGRAEMGLSHFKDGKGYVEYLCRSFTGTDYTPGQIIDILSDEVTQSTAELYRIISRNPDVLQELDRFDFGITQPEEIFEDLQEKSKADFPTPKATDYTVSYVPDFLEPHTAQAFYLLPPIDTTIVNRIYINASQIDDPIELYTVMAHEGYPGHMLQQLYFLEKKAAPLRSVFSYLGYLEGWAQYISYKSFEFNENASNDLIKAMQLNEIINYDVSALCDLYVNYSGFTEQQLEKYLSDNGFTSAVSHQLYTTFVNNPGVYLPYTVGSYEMRSLRAYAEEELGDAFSAYDFHRALLDIGQAPFYVVRREIENWVNSVKIK